jgi:hypothetical protein
MDKKRAATIDHVLGRNMRRVREEFATPPATLDDVAGVAQELGFTWDGSAVSRLERGLRTFTLDEMLCLPTMLTLATGTVVTFADLLPNGGYMNKDDDPQALLETWLLFAEPDAVAYKRAWWSEYRNTARKVVDHHASRALAARVPADDTMTATQWAEAHADDFETIQPKVLRAMMDLVERGQWGTPDPTRERERRLVVSDIDLTDMETVRLARITISNQLLAEVRKALAEEADGGVDQETGEREMARKVAGPGT